MQLRPQRKHVPGSCRTYGSHPATWSCCRSYMPGKVICPDRSTVDHDVEIDDISSCVKSFHTLYRVPNHMSCRWRTKNRESEHGRRAHFGQIIVDHLSICRYIMVYVDHLQVAPVTCRCERLCGICQVQIKTQESRARSRRLCGFHPATRRAGSYRSYRSYRSGMYLL